jgi:hypothetical protein
MVYNKSLRQSRETLVDALVESALVGTVYVYSVCIFCCSALIQLFGASVLQ